MVYQVIGLLGFGLGCWALDSKPDVEFYLGYWVSKPDNLITVLKPILSGFPPPSLPLPALKDTFSEMFVLVMKI